MKLHISSMLIAIMICTSGFAQDKPSPGQPNQTDQTQTTANNKQIKPFYLKSNIGLFTSANINFTPGNVIGANVGAKYFLMSRFAIRGGVSFSTSGSGMDRRGPQQFSYGQNDFNNMPGMKSANLTTFGASAYAMYYPVSVGKFSFYTGAGTAYNFLTGGNIVLVNGARLDNYRQNLFTVGGIIGTEYNISDNVNFSLEYNPTYLLGSRRNNINEINGQIGNDNIRLPGQQKFNAANFNLGAVYYFN